MDLNGWLDPKFESTTVESYKSDDDKYFSVIYDFNHNHKSVGITVHCDSEMTDSDIILKEFSEVVFRRDILEKLPRVWIPYLTVNFQSAKVHSFLMGKLGDFTTIAHVLDNYELYLSPNEVKNDIDLDNLENGYYFRSLDESHVSFLVSTWLSVIRFRLGGAYPR